MAVQADGKVLIGGWFSTLQPNGAPSAITRRNIARVNVNGTLDTGFDPNTNNSVFCMAPQADGKIVLGGSFTALQPNGAASLTARRNVARINADGTLDIGFDPNASGFVGGVAVQADGKLLLGGGFTTLQPNGAASPTARQFIARVNADGTLDNGFDPKANNNVNSVAVQADGKMLLGGGFTTLQPNGAPSPIARNFFARLYNDPVTQTLSTPNASQVLWQRGGGAPEVARVTFELSTNGGASWTPLGAGSRIGTNANWRRTGLTLPVTGQLRARGVTNGGQNNGSSGLVEQVVGFGPDPDVDGLLDSWELTYWPTAAGHNADDDFDYDGLTELQELAFGLNPTLPDAALQPAVVAENGYLTITLTKHPGAAYEVQSAGTLLGSQPASFSPATTTVLLETATTLKVRDIVLIGTPPARFLRVKVSAAP